MPHPFGGVAGKDPARLNEFDQACLLLLDDGVVLYDLAVGDVRTFELRLQLGDLVGERQHLRLGGLDPVNLLLRVGHLRHDAIDQRLDHVQLGSTGQLLSELSIDVGGQDVQRVDPAFEFVDELDAPGHARELGVEFACQFAEGGGRSRAVFHLGELADDCVHRGFELGRTGSE